MNPTKASFLVLVCATILVYSLFQRPKLKEKTSFYYNSTAKHIFINGIFDTRNAYKPSISLFRRQETLRLPLPLFYAPKECNTTGEDPISDGNLAFRYDNDQKKLILMYTTTYGQKWLPERWSADGNLYYINDQEFLCPRRCAFTDNKMFASRADAVVFDVLDVLYHTKPGETKFPKPTERRKDQIWVACTSEPALYHNCNALKDLNYLFNWTATYKLDSDIYWPYGYLYKLAKPIPLEDINLPNATFLKSKKLAASLTSNCNALGGRDLVINSLKKYVAIDSYGGCGDYKCPNNSDCREYLANHYKFFLAFENSLCQDYVTEKFFASLDLGIVPVTYGLANYAEIAPPHSYINAFDFPNTKALAEYLTYLDENDGEYLKYFHWKKNYATGHNSAGAHFCALCMKVGNPGQPKRITEGFNSWWNHKRNTSVGLSVNDTLTYHLLKDYTTGCVPDSALKKRNYLSA